ncbi:MAG: hypothetical protein J7L63_05945 [Thermoplasmata archaeon]|nr:hypothetical protein [Thermoplasmata archaeon]
MIVGECYICGRPAMHVCKLCGRAVCNEHYIASLGLCVRCAGKGEEKSPISH